LGWLMTLGQPESGITTYSAFTVAGKPTATDYNGRQVSMNPDWMGRPLIITSADGTVSQSFVYDTATNGKGHIASSSDGSVTTAYTYAGQGNRLDSLITTAVVQGTAQSFTQSFGYDTYGNRTAGTTSHAAWTQTYHPAAGLPNELKLGTASVATTPWTYYDPVSWAIKSIAYGNGAASTFDYGADQARLSEIKHLDGQMTIQAQWAYSYDQAGNLAREYDKTRPDGAGSWAFDQYGYDELNRLISAVVQSPTYGEQLQQFDYDAFGNRTSSNLMRVTGWSGVKGSSTAYTTASGLMSVSSNQAVNAAFAQGTAELLQNRLPAATSAGVPTGAQYDSQGNLTRVFEKPTSVNPVVLTMTYDALGRVLTVSSTRTGITEIYQYTAEGLRTVVQEYSGSILQKTRVNLYNDARQLVSQYEKTAAGALVWKRDILYLGTREAAEFDAGGMHVTQVDHLGSPRIVTGAAGQVELRQKYLPFGELLEQSGTFKTAKGYTNHEQSDASGLIYMQARFYVPWFGRFASPDPARDQHFDNGQSWNIYSYVRNNPVMSIDPTGMVLDDKDKASPSKPRSIAESMEANGQNQGFAKPAQAEFKPNITPFDSKSDAVRATAANLLNKLGADPSKPEYQAFVYQEVKADGTPGKWFGTDAATSGSATSGQNLMAKLLPQETANQNRFTHILH
jgi:RHS repeat-associated protein